MSTIIFAVGDLGFPRPGEGREANPKLEGVHQPNNLAIFSENDMELKKNWTKREQLRIYDQSYHQFFRKMTLLIESWSHQFRYECSNEFSTKI